MATYGPGNIAFTGFTPTLGTNTTGDANNDATSGSIQRNGVTEQDSIIVQQFRTPGNRKFRKLLTTLIGAAAGSSASEQRKRVYAQSALTVPIGGLVTIETVDTVNRNTTSADATMLIAMLNRVTYPATYPVDPSGNTGGGKVIY